MNRVEVHIVFQRTDSDPTLVTVDTALGSLTKVNGSLYPSELSIVNSIVSTLREFKDNFPTSKVLNHASPTSV